MKRTKLAYTIDSVKQIISLKRTKATLYMVVILWLAFATQFIVNRMFQENVQITEAFVKTNAEEMKSSLEIVAEYNAGFLSEASKKEMIQALADAIGLTIDGEILQKQQASKSEYYFLKRAKKAVSEIKVVSLEQEEGEAVKVNHYIIVRLDITESVHSIDKYKNLLEKTLDKLGVAEKQITMEFEGNYKGNMSVREKNEIATQLVEDLQGEIALEYEEGNLYTVYAYTGLLKEYIVSMGTKVNIQIAITYNDLTNKTRVTLATPILSQGW